LLRVSINVINMIAALDTSPGSSTNLRIHINHREMDLVTALCEKDEKTLAIVYKMYAPALLGIISRITVDREIAEDVLQETFLKIWNNIGQYQQEKGRFFTWMARLARNGAIDHLRGRGYLNSRKNDDLENLSTELDKTNHTSYNPDLIGIKHLAATLPIKQRELLDLIYFEGYSQSEAALELNIPLGTVKTRLRTAICTLRGLF